MKNTNNNTKKTPAGLFCRRFGFAVAGTAAVVTLLTTACAPTGNAPSSTAAAPAGTVAGAVAATVPAESVVTTIPSALALPETVPEAVAESPTFPIPVPTTTPAATTTTLPPTVSIPGTTVPEETIEPVSGVSGYEFTTQGGNGNTFFVKLGATHPLAVCFSFVDGDPRLSSLQASAISEAEIELADIGNRCVTAVSGEEFEVDTTDAAVGCVRDTGEITDVCANVGLPALTPAPAAEPEQPATPTTTTTPPVTTTTAPVVAAQPPPRGFVEVKSLAGYTKEEILVSPLGLFRTYPLPSGPPLSDNIGGSSSDENFYLWERGVYAQLNELGRIPLNSSIEQINGVWVRSTDQPEYLILVERYERFMNAGGYTIYNTCASERFPQVQPGDSMLDFIHRDTEPLDPAPLDRPLEWYLEQVAQSAYDNQQLKRAYSNEELPQQLLCDPLINAKEKWLSSSASQIWQLDDNRNWISHRPPENYEYHVMGLSSDRQVGLVVSCYVGDDTDEYKVGPRSFGILIWEDGRYKLWRYRTEIRTGVEYQSCEEAATHGGTIEGFDLSDYDSRFAGKNYELFSFGEYRFAASDLLPF